jgi:hypothetical protein
MARIDEVNSKLVKYFFEEYPNPLVNGIGIGYLSEKNSPELLVFVDPAAAACEYEEIAEHVERIARKQRYCLLRVSRFVGLQAATATSISPYDPSQYNVPPVMAGTLGAAVVESGGKRYILGSNHVLAHHGRVLRDTPVVTPGALDDANAGSVIGRRSDFVELLPPGWPPRGVPANTVDCALAEIVGAVDAPTVVRVRPIDPASGPIGVTKTGRSTGTRWSRIRIFRWHGYIDFTFGTYYFRELMGTYDERVVSGVARDDERVIFAAPGDSGALALDDQQRGVGLITARGYVFNDAGELVSYIILLCSLASVRDALRRLPEIAPNQIRFFR